MLRNNEQQTRADSVNWGVWCGLGVVGVTAFLLARRYYRHREMLWTQADFEMAKGNDRLNPMLWEHVAKGADDLPDLSTRPVRPWAKSHELIGVLSVPTDELQETLEAAKKLEVAKKNGRGTPQLAVAIGRPDGSMLVGTYAGTEHTLLEDDPRHPESLAVALPLGELLTKETVAAAIGFITPEGLYGPFTASTGTRLSVVDHLTQLNQQYPGVPIAPYPTPNI